MKKVLHFVIALALVVLFLSLGGNAYAQAPPYYTFDSTGGANSFPFNVALGKEVQWLVGAGEINRPTPVPSGYNITKVYFRANTSASPTFSNVTIKLGQTTLTSLPIGVVYTGPLTTVYFNPSITVTSTANGWISFTLDAPFAYDPSQSLVIDVQQCGMTGTGFTVNQRTYGTASTPRRTYLTSAACPQVYSGQDGTLCAFGVEVVPGGSAPFFDNFESYTVGQRLACQDSVKWTTWSNLPCNTTEDPLISDAFAFSGTKSVVIAQNNDLVRKHGNDTTGVHSISFKFRVPSSKAGYFNTLGTFAGASSNWAMQVYFDSAASGNNGRIFAGASTAGTFSYTHNAWHTAKVWVNLNIDSGKFYINGNLIRSWRWTAGTFGAGGPRRLAANNFFGATAWDQMYIDDYDYHQERHDLGVLSLAKIFPVVDRPPRQDPPLRLGQALQQIADAAVQTSLPSDDGAVADQAGQGVVVYPSGNGSFSLADTIRFRAVVRNYGTETEASYQLGWRIDGVNQTPVNRGSIAPGVNDTMTLQWNLGATGVHTLRAWTVLTGDGNANNDTATLNFSVGRVPGDTLYNFRIPNQLLLGIAKMGPSNKLVLTSGGQSNTLTTDNKYIVTTMRGTVLDTTHLQINNTSGQGFGFRDLAWDGRWLLTSDNPQVRRIDTATFTEVAAPFNGPGTLQRGLAADGNNRIWKSNFTTDPVVLFDTTGATLKTLGVPSVAPYGIAVDKWTSRNRMWLWYTQPSTTGIYRLSKVDTATGAIVATYDYSTMLPAGGSSGGLDIIKDHPDYPGAVVALMVTQLGIPGGGVISAIYLGQDSTSVGVGEEANSIPGEFSLQQNYPNPFNPNTTLRYAVPTTAHVTLSIYNVLGQRVATLRNAVENLGVYDAVWTSQNDAGAQVASGVYFYRMEAVPVNGGAPFVSMKKMILLK